MSGVDPANELGYLLDCVRAADVMAGAVPERLFFTPSPAAPHDELARLVPSMAVLSPATRHLLERTLLGALDGMRENAELRDRVVTNVGYLAACVERSMTDRN